MNKQALEKVKTDLYKSSIIIKTRLDLIEKYKTGLENIANRILGDDGKRLVEKYSQYVKKETHLVIPGRVEKRCITCGEVIYLYSFDTIDFNIPTIFSDINNLWYIGQCTKFTEILSESEKDWYINIRAELEKNSELANNLWREICDVFYNISEKQLKNFPEAYNLYIKYRS